MGNCMESDGIVPLNNPQIMDHSIDIYHFPASPPSRATLLLAKALGIKPNLIIVNILAREHMDPKYLKLNPMHTIPSINDDGFILWDSHVIMKYLVDQYGKENDALYPKEPKKAAIVTLRLFFEATYLFPRLAEYTAPVLFHNEQPNPEKARKFDEALEYLEMFLNDVPWVAGSDLTVADFSIITLITTAEAIRFNMIKYPNITSWIKRAKNAMAGFGYDEINQVGVNAFSAMFNSKIK